MRKFTFFKLMSFSLLAICLLQISVAKAKSLLDISSLSDGPPQLLGQKMGPTSYIEVETQKLTKARVVWVNWDYLRAAGFDIPSEELTPEIEKAILEAFAWGVRSGDEPENAFSKTKKKVFYADRYGGDFAAGNMGSGRAASAGSIQTKGIGKTKLVRMRGADHSNGVAGLEEGLAEAIAGEATRELPFGGNRVIAVLSRGTTTTYSDGYVQTNALIVREDPLRPAHYMKNLWGSGPLMDSEDQRTAENLKFILKALPAAPELAQAPDEVRTRIAVLAYAEHVAAQYAAAYALKIYHGATSTSNIETSGRFIDYGTLTTVPDYGKLKMLDSNDAFGDTNEFREVLMLEFLQNLRTNLPRKIAKSLPTDAQLGKHFLEAYRRFHHREFLRLTGLPVAEVARMENLKSSWALTDLMEQIATAGGENVLSPNETKFLTRYNLNRIIVKLAYVSDLDSKTLNEAIADEMPEAEDKDLRALLVRTYIQVMKQTQIDRKTLLAEAQKRNAFRPDLYRWNMNKSVSDIANKYKKDRDAKAAGDAVHGIIGRNLRLDKTLWTCEEILH